MEKKTEILNLINEYAVQENSSTLDRVIEEHNFDELAEEVVKLFAIPVVSNNEVAVSCATCKWAYAKYSYKCESCVSDSKWEQDTDY